MAMTIGTEYDHIDITNGVGTIRHPLKDASAREHADNLVKVQDAQPESDDNVVWVKETPENEVEVPTYEEFNELKSATDKLNEYNFTPGEDISYSNQTVSNVTVGANGYAKQQNGYSLYRFAVTAGDAIYINITAGEYTGWQFQNASAVEGTNRIGNTYQMSYNGRIVVPVGATYLAIGNSTVPIVKTFLSVDEILQSKVDMLESTWTGTPVNGSIISWENKRIAAATGESSLDNARLKTVSELPYYAAQISGNGYDFCVFAYSNGTYVGWWNGSEWTTANVVWSQNLATIPFQTYGYSIYAVAKRHDNANISTAESANFSLFQRIAYTNDEIDSLDARVSAIESADFGNNYAISQNFVKSKISFTMLGTLKYAQSFLIYNGKYYSTDGSHIAVQDASFNLLNDVSVNAGHGNAFCLGNANKGYISGWDDNKIYVINLDDLTIDSVINLPTTGYTTAAVDDINGITFIFQRDSHPSTVGYYHFIVYDYINDAIKSTLTISYAYAAMQGCDFFRDRIIVLNGDGTNAKPNGYMIYDKCGNIIGEYVLGDLSTYEPEGVFVDRITQEIYISFGTRLIYKIT